jgi:prevent-host-death family protein
MKIAVSEARDHLADLLRRALDGEEVVLTDDGEASVRLTPVRAPRTPEERRAVLERLQREAAAQAEPGPNAARSQDFLYDEDGLPR